MRSCPTHTQRSGVPRATLPLLPGCTACLRGPPARAFSSAGPPLRLRFTPQPRSSGRRRLLASSTSRLTMTTSSRCMLPCQVRLSSIFLHGAWGCSCLRLTAKSLISM